MFSQTLCHIYFVVLFVSQAEDAPAAHGKEDRDIFADGETEEQDEEAAGLKRWDATNAAGRRRWHRREKK